MTPKKRAAKKTTAKKAAAPEPQPQVDLLGDFPLQQDHYFHPPVVSPLAHDGPPATVQAIQRIVGAAETGNFDRGTAVAVRLWKQDHGLDDSPVIDHDTWDLLRKG